MNGYAKTNGHSFDMEDGSVFLFTSESVGEGHPGQFSSNIISQQEVSDSKNGRLRHVRRFSSSTKP